jgi:hypothetical protein
MRAVRATSTSASVPRMFICTVIGRSPMTGRRKPMRDHLPVFADSREDGRVAEAMPPPAGRLVIVERPAASGRAFAFALGEVNLRKNSASEVFGLSDGALAILCDSL